MITHHIIEKNKVDGEYYFVAKDDYNSIADPLTINKSQIYGKVVVLNPKIGFIQVILSNYIDLVKLFEKIKNHKRNEKRKNSIR